MPDRYGFDELGDEVACIEQGCDARGPRWQWPEKKRREHRLSHGTGAGSPTRPNRPNRGDEGGTTMGAKEKKVSGRQACVAAIRAAGKPLTANEIATAVVESGVVEGLKGKTPKATLSAQVTSGAKKGQTFKRVGSSKPAKFDLAADAPETPTELVDALKAKVGEVLARGNGKPQTADKKEQAPKSEDGKADGGEAAKKPQAAKEPVAAASGGSGKRSSQPDPKPGRNK